MSKWLGASVQIDKMASHINKLYLSGGEQKAVVEASLTITYLGEGTSIYADDLDYYILDITPEDTDGNKATNQYRIDNTYIDIHGDWVDVTEWEK